MNSDQYAIGSAVSVLSSALDAINKRLMLIEQAQLELTQNRKKYLVGVAAALLPEVGIEYLHSLQRSAHGFVTAQVREALVENKKFLGFFRGKAYRNHRDLLQTRLASHLDRMKYGDLVGIDFEVKRLAEEKRLLDKQANETLELIKLMQQAQVSKAPLPQALVQQAENIQRATRNRVPSSRAYSNNHVTPVHSYTSTKVESNDDFDLLFYIVTDIPTSFRTLLIDSVTENHRRESAFVGDGGSFGGGGASGDYDQGNGGNSGSAFESSASAGIATGIAAGGAALVGGSILMDVAPDVFQDVTTDNATTYFQDDQPVDSPSIATDDSLGYYS